MLCKVVILMSRSLIGWKQTTTPKHTEDRKSKPVLEFQREVHCIFWLWIVTWTISEDISLYACMCMCMSACSCPLVHIVVYMSVYASTCLCLSLCAPVFHFSENIPTLNIFRRHSIPRVLLTDLREHLWSRIILESFINVVNNNKKFSSILNKLCCLEIRFFKT